MGRVLVRTSGASVIGEYGRGVTPVDAGRGFLVTCLAGAVPARLVTPLRVVLVLVLLGSTLLTLTRLLQPGVGPALQLVAFTPFGLVGHGAALLLALLLVVAAPRVRRATAPLAVVAAVGLALHAGWFAPQVLGQAPAPAADGERRVVMGANLLQGRADAATVVRLVREERVQVLAASEITVETLRGLQEAGIDDLLPHRAGEPGEPGSVLGTMVFSTEPVDLVAEVPTFAETLLVRTGGVEVLAVHPSPPTLPGRWRDDAASVVEAVRTHEPDVVVGDFNATDDHRPVLELADDGWLSAARLLNAGWAPTWPEGDTYGLLGALGPLARIDHVLVAPGWTATTYADHVVPGTDHRAVVATVATVATR